MAGVVFGGWRLGGWIALWFLYFSFEQFFNNRYLCITAASIVFCVVVVVVGGGIGGDHTCSNCY